jgi:hypothetical protein
LSETSTSFTYRIPGDALQQELIDNTIPKTLWQKINLHLQKNGYEAYAPGQKRDKCIEPYVVIKESGDTAMYSNVNGYRSFDIIIYYPLESYSEMEPYADNVMELLKGITELRFTGNQTPYIVDDEVQAYTTSISYQQFKSLRR